MSTESLKDKLEHFALYAQEVRPHCEGKKQQTRQSLIDPYLEEILGVNSRDPKIVKLGFSFKEVLEKFPTRNNVERVDYAIFEPDKSSEDPVWIIEAEVVGSSLDYSSISRLRSHLISTKVKYAALTNGIQWHWYNLYTWDRNFLSEASLFFKNDVCQPSDQDLEWLSTVREGLHKSSAEVEAAKQEFVPRIRCWIQKMARNPSQVLQQLVKYECKLPASKLIEDEMPVMLSNAFHDLMFTEGKMGRLQQRRLSDVSGNRFQNSISITSGIQKGISRKANDLIIENEHLDEKPPFPPEEAYRPIHAFSVTELSKEMPRNLKSGLHQTSTLKSYQDFPKVRNRAKGVLYTLPNDEMIFDKENHLVSQDTRQDGWSEWQREEKSRVCRYMLNEGDEWIEVNGATDLLLDILKWCAQEHKNGKNNYYLVLSNTGFGRRNTTPILIHRNIILPSRSRNGNGLPPNGYYSRAAVDGWRIFKNLSNSNKKRLVEEILAKCIRSDDTSPALGKDLWIGIPNA